MCADNPLPPPFFPSILFGLVVVVSDVQHAHRKRSLQLASNRRLVLLSPSQQELINSSAQLVHDLISMTLMKGSGLLDEVDGLIGLL